MKNKNTNWVRLFVVLFVAFVVLVTLLTKLSVDHINIAPKPVPMVTCKPNSDSDREIVGAKLRRLSNEISQLQRTLYTSSRHFNSLGEQVALINNLLKLLGTNSKRGRTSTQDVCPEKFDWLNEISDVNPYYQTSSHPTDCADYIPIDKLITILFHMKREPMVSYVEIMQRIEKYENIRVILATTTALPKNIISTISKMKISFENVVIDGREGNVWAMLLKQVTTPCVLIAPRIARFDEDIDLYRLVRVLSYHDDVAVAGGSFRNLTGHWDLGCQQVTFDYWTAKYTAGYYQSFDECNVCDYLPGPFAAKTKLLEKLQFDKSLSNGVFRDLFWRLKHLNSAGNIAVVCSDVMFNVDTPHVPDEALVSFAEKHQIKKIVNVDGSVRWYGCRRGLSYTKGKKCAKWPDGIGAPPCDLWNLGEVIKFVMVSCDEGKMACEYAAGTVLGAVKFASVIPWEKDADIHFHTNNFTAFKKLRPKFEKAGFTFYSNPKGLGFFTINTKKWHLAMYGRKTLEVGDMIHQGKYPTRVPISGAWVTVPRNPGMFSRNHYVTNYLRHAEHHGGDSFYSAGMFKKCPTPGHSGCLDRYPADGNIQFLDYLP